MVDWQTVSDTALRITIMIISVIVVGVFMIAATFLYLRYRRYMEYVCIIFKRDGFGQLIETKDTAGIFIDSKTNNKRFFLRKNKVGLNPNHIPYLPSKRDKKTVYLYQTGLKNFHFIKLKIKEPTIDLCVGEEDVNWAINAYERQKKLFQSTLLMQLLPFIAIAFTSIIILIIFIYFFKEFSTLKVVAQSFNDAANSLVQLKANTTVIMGG